MTKADLKTGMVVETRLGERYLVMLNPDCKDRELINFNGGFNPLSLYKDDLTMRNEERMWDITRVFSLGSLIDLILCKPKELELFVVWERKKETPVEMTVSEIEKKLGIKNLKIVKE